MLYNYITMDGAKNIKKCLFYEIDKYRCIC